MVFHYLTFRLFPWSSGRAEALSELLASVRRQGIREASLLKDGDNILQCYRNLETKLQKQTEAQSALERELEGFHTQAESIGAWVRDRQQRLTSRGSQQSQPEERKNTAQVSESGWDFYSSHHQPYAGRFLAVTVQFFYFKRHTS